MLVSAINMLLRDDEFDTLEDLCNSFDRDPAQVIAYLGDNGYVFSTQQKQFRPAGYDC